MQAKDLTKQALIAAVYAVLCIAFAPISYGAVQFRIPEMLMVLPFYNRKYTVGLTLGCLIANFFSELGMWDMIFGTFATFLACLIIRRLKMMRLIAPVAAIINGIIIGAELFYILKLPFWASAMTVAFGELVVVSAGVAAFKLIEQNERMRQMIVSMEI